MEIPNPIHARDAITSAAVITRATEHADAFDVGFGAPFLNMALYPLQRKWMEESVRKARIHHARIHLISRTWLRRRFIHS
jgi:hypothetical protein